tara:strand:+ start:2403 stop:4466 length:2064 start_codon:yes stop_codon:yes gene_type:complete
MAEYSIKELEQKFMNAHNAGDTKAAKLLKDMIVSQKPGKAPKAKSWELSDGGLRFDKLQENESYVSDLKKVHRALRGNDWDGSDEELIEDSFEYFNSTLNNELSLAGTTKDIFDMDDDTKASMNNVFNTYNNTNITGEGSRPLLEQAKDAASLLWAPSTYFGGKFIAGGAMHMGAKQGIKKLLSGSVAKRSGLVAGGIVGAHDAGIQLGVEGQLDEEKEFDWKRAALSTGMGLGLGAAAPVAIKGVGKLISGTGQAVTGTAKAIASPIQSAQTLKGAAIKTAGGGEAAREGVAREAKEILDNAVGTGGKEEAAAGLNDNLNRVISKGKIRFTKKYDELGEIKVTQTQIKKLVKDLHAKPGVSKIGNLQNTIDAMVGKELTPTQALRKIRSTLGKESNRALRGVGPNISSDQVLNNFYKQSRNLFTASAKKAGKGNAAKKLDKDYSDFLRIRADRTIINATEDSSAATRKLVNTISSKDPHKVDEFIKQMDKLGTLSGDAAFGKAQKANLQMALHEHLFTGTNAAPLKRFLGDKSGIKVLQKVYGDVMDKQAWQGYADILENAADHGGLGVLMTRILAGGAGAFTGGPFGAVGGYVAINALMKSKAFQRQAMKVFSNNPKKKTQGLGAIAKIMESKGIDGPTRKKIQDLLVGSATIGGSVYAAKDTTDTEMVKQGLKSLDPSISQYFE